VNTYDKGGDSEQMTDLPCHQTWHRSHDKQWSYTWNNIWSWGQEWL